jgi:EAL domain-containing protein (putative c-di-GMP-specific phosphodiesterase class I)
MLHALPFDILKIDREFISRMVDDPDAKQIVASILFMARKLELDVVAEGIETDEQLAMLRSMRCKHGQGYLLGKPMRIDDAEKLIRAGRSRSRRSRARAS